MRRLRLCVPRILAGPAFAIVLIAFVSVARAQVIDASKLPDVLRLIPPDAHAVVLVPHLKHASDHLTRLLEGMDRANLLLGSRPIDQLKSITGLNIGVNDHGAAAIVVMDAATPPRIAWLMPVNDAQAFLEGNFTGRDGEAYTRDEHMRVFAKSLGSHVVMSGDQAIVQAYSAEQNLLATLEANFGKSGRWAKNTDMMVIVQQPMVAAIKRRALANAQRTGMRLPAIAVMASSLADDVSALLFAVEFDALALIVRGEAHFREGSQFGTHAPMEIAPDAGLARLPNKPLALAMSIDLAALGGDRLLKDMAEAAGDPAVEIPSWLSGARSMQIAIAPNPAGAKGGLLDEMTVTLASNTPGEVRDALREAVLASDDDPSFGRGAKWLDAQTLGDGSKADAYEIRITSSAPEAASVRFVEGLFFGSSGMRGYVRALEQAVVITLAQRPAMLAAACESARQAASNPETGLAASPATSVIRQWMPAQRDIEMYLGIGQITAMLEDFARSLAMNQPKPLSELFGAHLPRVGLALDVSPRRVDGAAVIPAGVLAPMFDEGLRLLQSMRPVRLEQP